MNNKRPISESEDSNDTESTISCEIELQNNSSNISKYNCIDCQSKFTDIYHYRHHLKHVHLVPSENLPKDEMTHYSEKNPTIICNVCNKTFKKKKYLNVHKKNKHNIASHSRLSVRKCPVCKVEVQKAEFEKHLDGAHDIKLIREKLMFDSVAEFINWKENIEKESKAKFTQMSSKKNKDITYLYFLCHRSGDFISKSKGQRSLKWKGSKKINSHCPASINCSINGEGKCSVTYTPNHIGHLLEVGHLSLSVKEREMIASKIAAKIPFQNILDEVRDSIQDEDLQRIDLLTRKDLHNIESSFNLDSNIIKHKNDFISVEAWVKEMELENNCILFYKAQDSITNEYPELKKEDFMLVIMNDGQKDMFKNFSSDCISIDGTHGLKGYELFTLLVIDDLREGFPCAFCISNRSDEKAMAIFYTCIKNEVGVAAPKVFMSDMAESFFNAWCKVMSKPEKRLFCTWHVDQAWRNNLKKVKSEDKKDIAYKIVRTLLEETDIKSFNIMLNEAIKILKSDEDTLDFGIYFETYYARDPTLWAYCHRLYCGVNTNMHIERMHRTIKYSYFLGKKVQRLDKAISALMRFIRDKLTDRLIALNKGKLTSKISQLRQRHKTSLKLSLNISKDANKNWMITSENQKNVYMIEEIQNDCTCRIICQECGACIHKFRCTCIDCSIKWNMCKHIHFLCLQLKNESGQGTENPLNTDLTIDESNIESQQILKNLGQSSANSIKKESLSLRKEKLLNLYSELINSITDDEALEVLEKSYRSSKCTVQAVKNKKNSKEQSMKTTSPVNKNITPQRFKKGKKKMKVPLKPSDEECQKTALSLILNSKSDE